jgi:hypothetical protein
LANKLREVAMANLWTKNGIPLSCQGNDVFSRSGTPVGHLVGDRVFRHEDGEYVGTIVGDRLIHRSFDLDGPNRPYTRRVSVPDADLRPPVIAWGDEPVVPD